jgi:putative ABC transport system permease protein
MPLNFLNTLKSPEFVRYMGVGQCDIRVDLQHTEDIGQRYADVLEYMKADAGAEKYATLFTSIYQTVNDAGEHENIKIDVGDFSIFPLEYTAGSAPDAENEIALSVMNAEELGKNAGDTMTVIVEDQPRELTICGLYQDVTNGGRTAKAILPVDVENAVWFTLNLDVKDGVSITEKMDEYKEAFYPAKVTDVRNYVYQTMGSIIDQLNLVVKAAFVLGLAVAVLITAMFFKMLIAKDASGIAIMRSLGLSYREIRLQYVTRAIFVLVIGIVIGTIAAVTLGQSLAGMMISGVSSMRFDVDPLMSFVVCPLSLAAAVAVTVLLGSASIKKISLMLVAE